jgi:hypothetical protein
MKKLISLAVVLIAVVASWAFFNSKGTEVSFQSSDGEWADSEILFKGRTFNDLLVNFELYKLRCAPNVSLQRTTRQPEWYEPIWWFNDYTSPKWHVPFAEALPKTKSGYYPPVTMKHCANRPSTFQEFNVAEERARQYLAGNGP